MFKPIGQRQSSGLRFGSRIPRDDTATGLGLVRAIRVGVEVEGARAAREHFRPTLTTPITRRIESGCC